jgi:hypothetical protein
VLSRRRVDEFAVDEQPVFTFRRNRHRRGGYGFSSAAPRAEAGYGRTR